MFKKIKLILLNLVLAFSISNQIDAQSRGSMLLLEGGSYNNSWLPSFLDTNYTQTANTMEIINQATKSKVSKDSGGTRFIDYTKVYRKADSLGTVDSIPGKVYNINITELNNSLWFSYQYYGYWKQKDKDTVWVYSDIDSVFIPDFYDCIPALTPSDFTDLAQGLDFSSYISDSIVVTDVDCDINISIVGGGYRIGALGKFVIEDGTVSENDTIWLQIITERYEYDTAYTAYLTIEGQVLDWSVYVPDYFLSFIPPEPYYYMDSTGTAIPPDITAPSPPTDVAVRRDDNSPPSAPTNVAIASISLGDDTPPLAPTNVAILNKNGDRTAPLAPTNVTAINTKE